MMWLILTWGPIGDPYVAHNFDHNLGHIIKLGFPFEKWVPIGYPYARSALEGSFGPAKKNNHEVEPRKGCR